jgi:predicted nuclease of predicted toxin-antitoxin system
LKLLLDTCLSARAKAELKAAGHDVVCAGDWPEDPGDEAILARGYEQRRVLVTLDKDFAVRPVWSAVRRGGLPLSPVSLLARPL